MEINEYKAKICEGFMDAGVNAYGWYAGGGIDGVKIELSTGYELFTSFEKDSDKLYEWLTWDFTSEDGDCVAMFTTFSRPYGTDESIGGAATPDEVVKETLTLLCGLDPEIRAKVQERDIEED